MSLLEMSFAGGLVILVVVLLRALTMQRLPRATFTVLWAVAVLRLLVPVTVPSAVSVYGLLRTETAAPAVTEAPMATPAPVAVKTAPAAVSAVPAAGDRAPAAEKTAPAAPAADDRDIPWETLLWAAGALGLGAYFALGYVTAFRRFREAVTVEDGYVRRWQDRHPMRRRVSVRLSGRVDAPMTYGLLRPVVLLPADTDWHDQTRLGLILGHEYAHIRRLDGLKKLILTAAVCLHWFNPLVWVMLVLANRDMEMACDEQVVRGMDGDGRADYARALIDMAEARSGLTPLVSHFSKSAMEERVTAIMKGKRITALAVVMSILLTLGVTAVFATGPAAPDSGPAGSAEEQTAYAWGGARVLLPLDEEGVEAIFPRDEIEWWTAEDFSAWAFELQKPLLEAAEGSEYGSGSAHGVWTEERIGQLLAAYEDITQALEDGAKLSRTIDGDSTVAVAVGMDWGLNGGLNGGRARGTGYSASAYDVETLLWGGEDTEAMGWEHTVFLGEELGISFGPSQTLYGLLETMKAFFDQRVAAGAMTRDTVDDIFLSYLAGQEGVPLEQYVSEVPAMTPAPAEAADEPELTPPPLAYDPADVVEPELDEPHRDGQVEVTPQINVPDEILSFFEGYFEMAKAGFINLIDLDYVPEGEEWRQDPELVKGSGPAYDIAVERADTLGEDLYAFVYLAQDWQGRWDRCANFVIRQGDRLYRVANADLLPEELTEGVDLTPYTLEALSQIQDDDPDIRRFEYDGSMVTYLD